jgi:hypothetical protein
MLTFKHGIGVPTIADPNLVQRASRYCPQFSALFPNITVWEHLSLYATLYGYRGAGVRNRANKLVLICFISASANQSAREYLSIPALFRHGVLNSTPARQLEAVVGNVATCTPHGLHVVYGCAVAEACALAIASMLDSHFTQ